MNEVFDYQVGDVYGPINALVLTKDPTNDNVGIVDQTSIDTYGKTEIIIDDNPILGTDREGLLATLFDTVNGITYQSTTIEYPGDPSLDVGDIVSFLDQDLISTDLTILSIVFEHTGTWSGFLSAISPSKTDIDTDFDGDLTKRVKRAEIRVDKQSGEISLLGQDISIIAQNVDDLNGAKTELETKIDGVTITVAQQVDKISDLQNSADENAAAIDANADAIALQKTYYNFGSNGQTIGRDDSPAQIRMEYDVESKPQVVITDGYNDTTKIKSNGMNTKNITVEESLVVGNHKIQKVTGSTTETIFFPI
jgi:methyl-accepting chemotaxis protein